MSDASRTGGDEPKGGARGGVEASGVASAMGWRRGEEREGARFEGCWKDWRNGKNGGKEGKVDRSYMLRMRGRAGTEKPSEGPVGQ